MYATCFACTRGLGRNAVLTRFSVGRQVAYDPVRGRLWAVCPHCARWNLAPLEERWEAIDEAERLYHDARHRVCTDRVGRVRLRGGATLIRIGAPRWWESAAWRQAECLVARRAHRAVIAGLAVALGAVVCTIAGGVLGIWGAWVLLQVCVVVLGAASRGLGGRRVARLPTERGELLDVRRRDLGRASFIADTDGGFAVRIRREGGDALFTGMVARFAATRLLADVNRFGGTRRQIARATARLAVVGGAERYLASVAASGRALTRPAFRSPQWGGHAAPSGLLGLDATERLAIALAIAEDEERRSLGTELLALEQAWAAAEETAAIADTLLLPEGIAAQVTG